MTEYSEPFLNTTLDYSQDQFNNLNLTTSPADAAGIEMGYTLMGMSQTYPGKKVYYAPNTQRDGWYTIYVVNQSGGRRKSRKYRKSRKSRRHRKRTYKRR